VVVWRYIFGGTVCGAAPEWFSPVGWYGTGSQKEYEELARRRPCQKCVSKGYTPEKGDG
jgi:hypothetical protein